MKIVFFGTGDFSRTILKGLIDMGQTVVAVVTQPDKVNARNGKIIPSEIKTFCLDNSLPLYQFNSVSKEGEDTLKSYNADLFVTASFGQIIKQNILDIPRFGTINVHASLLPKYRGSSPIQWAIMNGEKKTGITIMQTVLALDAGDIFLQKEIAINEDDTSSSVFNKLSTLGVECLREFFDNFNYYISNSKPQDESQMTYYPMIKKEDFLLDFNQPAEAIVNKIRALENCYFVFKGARYKIQKATKTNLTGKSGEVLKADSKNGFVIACKEDAINVEIMQPEGKQKMPAKNYMNSNKFKVGDELQNS